ncbi:UDP-3-O-(3-hydroxymyristoyl)glucosamine N-acyltransferase [Alteromonas facilis]|uniref:UDP-3-O-(3-hydroxymyristoyl)glucosamine N-acyltransferase n=1 Tax=Alteromonas facilis TaxID=2048004 RepID=UPI000C28268E|nr:UDP-3-O-(3-hydroxymyristoyl)glucosamine N-acyltransferase [Alteromonas facilis]
MQQFSVSELALHVGAEPVNDDTLNAAVITGVNTLMSANAQQLSFFTNSKYKGELAETNAGVVLVSEEHADLIRDRALIVSNPHVAFAKVAQLFDSTPRVASGIASSAVIASTARLGENVSVGPNAVIGEHAYLGDNVQIGANSVIGEHVEIGQDSVIFPNVTVYHRVQLGQQVTVHSQTVLGSDGFGYANERGEWLPIPQTGTVIVGDRSQIGAGCTIDRGALEDTIIGTNVIIDNQVHVAHNCRIGDHSCICGQTGMAGSVTIGKYVVIAGGVVINGHLSIADKVQITGFSMITSDITEAGVYSSGQPALPNKEWRKNAVRARQLDDLFNRVKQLEKQLGK